MLRFIADYSIINLVGSVISLAVFAVVVSIADTGIPGRTYALYGGIYIAAAFTFFALSEGAAVTKFDTIGVMLSLMGAYVIYLGSLHEV